MNTDEPCGMCGEYDVDAGGSCTCTICHDCGERNHECVCPRETFADFIREVT